MLIEEVCNSGILASGTRGTATMHYNDWPAPRAVIERVRKFESYCEHHAISQASAELSLAHSPVANVIPGLGCATYTEQTINLRWVKIPRDFRADFSSKALFALMQQFQRSGTDHGPS